MTVRLPLLTLVVCGCIGRLAAQSTRPTGSASVATEVVRVRFDTKRDPAGADWWEAEVELRVANSPGKRDRPLDRVGVALSLATVLAPAPFEETEPAAGFRYYRCLATAVALSPGRAVYRFYLPPVVVERDRLRGEPPYWEAVVSLDGQALPPTRRSVGAGLAGPAAVAAWRQQLAQRAPPNDGVLVPWFLSPFPALNDPAVPAVIRLPPDPPPSRG